MHGIIIDKIISYPLFILFIIIILDNIVVFHYIILHNITCDIAVYFIIFIIILTDMLLRLLLCMIKDCRLLNRLFWYIMKLIII